MHNLGYSAVFMCMLLSSLSLKAQSFELMTGHEAVFVDVQWLQFFDDDKQFSLFSRTRATSDYNSSGDVFTGAYFNYTTRTGIGPSLVGKINRSGVHADAGVHLFKSRPDYMLFALVSMGIKTEPEYSWFSIFRYTPSINENMKLYTSLELYTLFVEGRHQFSVQRIRLGISRDKLQFGLAANLNYYSEQWILDDNLGVFIRKVF